MAVKVTCGFESHPRRWWRRAVAWLSDSGATIYLRVKILERFRIADRPVLGPVRQSPNCRPGPACPQLRTPDLQIKRQTTQIRTS
jgi:hypothetical protein